MKVLICLALVVAVAQANPALLSIAPGYSSYSYAPFDSTYSTYLAYKRAALGPGPVPPVSLRERRAIGPDAAADANKLENKAEAQTTRDGRDLLITSGRYGYSSYPYSSYGYGLGSRYVSAYSYPRYAYSGLRDYSGLSSSSLVYV